MPGRRRSPPGRGRGARVCRRTTTTTMRWRRRVGLGCPGGWRGGGRCRRWRGLWRLFLEGGGLVALGGGGGGGVPCSPLWRMVVEVEGFTMRTGGWLGGSSSIEDKQGGHTGNAHLVRLVDDGVPAHHPYPAEGVPWTPLGWWRCRWEYFAGSCHGYGGRH